MGALAAILIALLDGSLTVAEAIAALAAEGFVYVGTATVAAVANYIRSIGGGQVACNNTHSSKVQGPGTCCLAVQSGALIPPAPGTTLPVYTPGQAYTLPPGRIATVTDSAGHCASCMIVGSKSTKHPGRPVLKYIRGGPSCPTSGQGCCTLQGGSI